MQIAMLLGLLVGVSADCYLQYPPGSNNRLDEGGGNRNNNNRLMDTQNNAKGGYGYGGEANNAAEPLKYMEGSVLNTGWTSQHSCGSTNNECQIVVQYMCNPAATTAAGYPTDTENQGAGQGEGPARDGTDNGTPDPNNPDANTGLHEPASFYNDCADRDRNKGLYTADQNLNDNQGATATRQNPNGNRSGQECPEERDYYPYWHPSPWKDVAIVTNNLALCDWYKQESQNVKGKNYCSGGAGTAAGNTPATCAAAGGTWSTQPAFGIAAPECVAAPVQRDNHLGNVQSGQESGFNWTIPSAAGVNGAGDASNCVARFRYNITTADTQVCEDPTLTTKAQCVAAGKIWSAAYLSSTNNNAVEGNNNAANGNNNPPLLEGNPDMDMGGTLTDTGGENSLLELAVNTNQYGRTFQDRTHVFEIQSRPPAIGASTVIHNLNVKGKRGNIVQTYPATEYDFTPNPLVVGSNDMVHVQWTGNDNTNNNGNNNGEGTNNEDRHNIVQLSYAGQSVATPSANQADMFDVEWEWNPESTGTFSGTRATADLTQQFALSKQTGCLTEAQINGDQQRQNCQKLNAAAATVDLGIVKFKKGDYDYMSSRNNNFSNRAQKAKLTVLQSSSVPPGEPVGVTVTAVDSGDSSKASAQVSWNLPGSQVPYTGFDGKSYMGMEQQASGGVVDFYVEYSIQGGSTGTWVAAGPQCTGNIRTCTVDGLPAGTPTVFRVKSGSVGGWGAASAISAVKTADSDTSRECNKRLLEEAEGKYTNPGEIVAIVFGVIAILLLIGAVIFVMRRRQPPPPPAPQYKAAVPPAY